MGETGPSTDLCDLAKDEKRSPRDTYGVMTAKKLPHHSWMEEGNEMSSLLCRVHDLKSWDGSGCEGDILIWSEVRSSRGVSEGCLSLLYLGSTRDVA